MAMIYNAAEGKLDEYYIFKQTMIEIFFLAFQSFQLMSSVVNVRLGKLWTAELIVYSYLYRLLLLIPLLGSGNT